MGEEISDVKISSDLASQEKTIPQEEIISIHNGHDSTSTTSVERATKEEQSADNVFQINVSLPHQPYEIQVMVSTQEQVQDLRQSIIEMPSTFQYSCFHLEFNELRINDFAELSEIKGLTAGSTVKLFEDPYTEKEARMHLIRVREIIGAAGDRFDTLYGISAGVSLHDTISLWRDSDVTLTSKGNPSDSGLSESTNALAGYNFEASPALRTLLPPTQEVPPKTVKSIGVSTWNPPPPHLRHKGHLLYLQVTTNEGEQYQITSHISGFFVNKSSNSKFDPLPRPSPKNAAAHSLFTLIGLLSPSFDNSFNALLELNNKRDPLTNFQLTSAIPSTPWLVDPAILSLSAHRPDLTRSQETFLMAGAENTETMRDWNEEIQSTKELPRDSIQESLFREKLMAKIFAEFNEAAARGAVLVAQGEIAPLNPTEGKDAQIFVYNNIFYSFGADGVGTFTSEGGDSAARVAVGKDVKGVKAVNQLDISGLSTPGTILVDFLGKRLVAQSIVPGIFKQREPDEHQVDYGGVEGRDVIAHNDAFVPSFSSVSKALKVKRHAVWDKDGKKHMLEGSVETKGLLGTDGRKYILDLYRLTPLDISWLDEYWTDSNSATKPKERNYPHRLTVLRLELIETYWRLQMSDYIKQGMEKQKSSTETEDDVNGIQEHQVEEKAIQHETTNGTSVEKNGSTEPKAENIPVDISGFSLAFNPDVFCGQTPQTDEEKQEWAKDESNVRAVCTHLHQKVLPELLQDLKEGDVGFPMDGQSLSRLMHKRGINIRYLGKLASLTQGQGTRLQALKALTLQEMITRAFKHVANGFMKDLPPPFATACLAHLLNCLLGADLNKTPTAQLDEDLQFLYKDANYSFSKLNAATMKSQIEFQVYIRYRYTLEDDWMTNIKHIQLLREICLKLGLQIAAKDYRFTAESIVSEELVTHGTNGTASQSLVNGSVNGHANGANSKKSRKNNGENNSPVSLSGSGLLPAQVTFIPDDIPNIVPIVKDACSKSQLAEEALEAGRISLTQNQKEVGQELLLESLSLHEQIYGILHPEVARVYHQLAMLYYQLDEKSAAVELAHKAVIISERTLGIDSSETILSYLNLGLFEHGIGHTGAALSCMKHALELWKIIYGLKHPDSITTINNAAVMLQHLKFYHESRQWFEISLAISEEVSGKSSVNTATLSFQLAQALALDQEPKSAVQRMRDAYSVFLAKLGPEDRNTKEAETWLEQLTQNAVSIAKHAKDLQARKLRKVLLTSKVNLNTRPQPQIGQSSADLVNGPDNRGGRVLDSRSIDELLKFIEGGSDTTKKKPPKKRNTPRERRG